MRSSDLAKKYARAWLDITKNLSDGDKEKDLKVIKQLSELISSNTELREAFKSPLVKKTEKVDLVLALIPSDLIKSQIGSFLSIIAQNGRIGILSQVLKEIETSQLKSKGVELVYIETPSELSDTSREKIEKSISQKIGAPIFASYSVNRGIIGGFRVWHGDKLLDKSLLSGLRGIKRVLVS